MRLFYFLVFGVLYIGLQIISSQTLADTLFQDLFDGLFVISWPRTGIAANYFSIHVQNWTGPKIGIENINSSDSFHWTFISIPGDVCVLRNFHNGALLYFRYANKAFHCLRQDSMIAVSHSEGKFIIMDYGGCVEWEMGSADRAMINVAFDMVS